LVFSSEQGGNPDRLGGFFRNLLEKFLYSVPSEGNEEPDEDVEGDEKSDVEERKEGEDDKELDMDDFVMIDRPSGDKEENGENGAHTDSPQ